MKIIDMDIGLIKPYEKNPRNNDEAVEKVANSIKEFGFKVPIVIDKENVIVAGHTRYKASIKLGLKQVPCIVADDLNEEQVKAFRLADNKVGELATWDDDLLLQELDDIINIDMEDFGFLDDVEDIEEPKQVEEDDFEEDNIQQRVKKGQIWQLGNHRLMCGDSTKLEDVNKLMQNEKADLLITDPPYNVDYTGKTEEELKINNDKMEDKEFYQFLLSAFKCGYESMKDGSSFYVWYASKEVVNFCTALKDAGLTVKQELIWNKNSLVMGRQDYQWKHEPCLYGWKETGTHKWYGDRKQTTVLEFDRPTRSALHPTMKPIDLFAYQIQNSSKENDSVLDLFSGSGTTIMCCEQLNRKAYCMEYDEHYADVIINRWEQYTEKEAVLLSE